MNDRPRDALDGVAERRTPRSSRAFGGVAKSITSMEQRSLMQAEPRQRRRAVGRRGAGNLQLERIGDGRDGREGESHRRREERSSTRFPSFSSSVTMFVDGRS